MAMTKKQAYVLANLDRVVPFPYKLDVVSQTFRYQLEGLDCTRAIIGLMAQRLVIRRPNGRLERTGERQRPPPEAFKLLRDALIQPPSVHRDLYSASATAAGTEASTRSASIAP